MDRRALLARLGAIGALGATGAPGALAPAALAQGAPAAGGSGVRRPTATDPAVVDVRLHGAVGDGKTDDTRAIQGAIDHALRTGRPAVLLPAGQYRTTDTLHLGYGLADFSAISLIGEGSFAFAGTMAGATLLPTRVDRPALNVQGGRGNVIRNISIRGANHAHGTRLTSDPTHFAAADPLAWLDPAIGAAGLRRFAPYAAITIDAYAGPLKPDGYPAPPLPPWAPAGTAQGPRSFSSDVLIDRCWIGGFGVGVAIQPCDADGNADFVKLTASTIVNCVYGIAIGNSQSRNVAIRDCTYAVLHTFITNRRFGRQVGTLNGPIDNLSGGAAYQTLDIGANAAGPVTISHHYFEAQARIGQWSLNAGFNNALTFQSCRFSLGEEYLNHSPGALLECGPQGAVRFVDCTFNNARRIYHPVRGASSVTFDGCMFGHLSEPLRREQYKSTPPYMVRALAYLCGGVFMHGDVRRGDHALKGGLGLRIASGSGTSAPYGPVVAPAPGRREVLHHYAREVLDRSGRTWRVVGRRRPGQLRKLEPSGMIRAMRYAAPDMLEMTCDPRLEQVLGYPVEAGDIVYDQASGTVLVVAAVEREAGAIRVSATQLNSLRGGQTVASSRPIVQEDGYLWLYSTGVAVSDTVHFGDFKRGERLVGNVHGGEPGAKGLAAALIEGDVLHWAPAGPPLPGSDLPMPYPVGTRIAAVDEAARTVTLDRPATATARFLVSPAALA